MDIGARLRRLRKSRKLTEKELADMTNISQPVINRLENNAKAHDVESIKRICSVYGMTLSGFFSEEEIDIPPDIRDLVKDPKNYGLLRLVQAMMNKGYSNDVITEWINSLDNTLTNMRARHDLGGATWMDEGLLPEEARGKYTEEQKKEALEKYKQKTLDQNRKPPWEKQEN